MTQRVSLVGITGIIGAGKTTLMEALNSFFSLREKNEFKILFAYEPVALWKGRGWLQGYYDDPETAGFPFQLLVFDTYIENILRLIEENRQDERHLVIVTERTMYDQMMFWMEQKQAAPHPEDPPGQDPMLSKSPYRAAYARIWTKWNRFIPTPSLIVFLKTSTLELTMERVRHRARCSEEVSGVTAEYQEGLLRAHEVEYTEPKTQRDKVPCIHLCVDDQNVETYAALVGERIIKIIESE